MKRLFLFQDGESNNMKYQLDNCLNISQMKINNNSTPQYHPRMIFLHGCTPNKEDMFCRGVSLHSSISYHKYKLTNTAVKKTVQLNTEFG